MSAILEVLTIVAPVFFLASIGFGWVKLGLVYDLQFVTRIAMTLSIPCLIFMALARANIEPQALSALVLATVVAYALVAAVMVFFVLVTKLEIRTYLAPLVFGNTGNVGLPVALFAYGQEGLALAVVVFAIMALLSFTIGVWLVSGGGNPLAALKEPMVGATFLGGLFLYMGWQLPVWAENTLDLIGQMGIPLMLITLGVAIARLQAKGIGRALIISVTKYAVCIAVPAWTAVYFGLSPMATGVLVLQVAMPIAVTSYMLAEKYKARSDEVAGMVVVSTVLAVFVIPAILAVVV
jgi:predicted permease